VKTILSRLPVSVANRRPSLDSNDAQLQAMRQTDALSGSQKNRGCEAVAGKGEQALIVGAAAGINITRLLCEVLEVIKPSGAKSDAYERELRPFWHLVR
jgi:hypothetical protein